MYNSRNDESILGEYHSAFAWEETNSWCTTREHCKCDKCGGFYVDEGGYNKHICDGCLEEAHTVETAINFASASEDTASIEINGALAHAFSEEDIHSILVEYCKAHPEYAMKVIEYIDMDDIAFIEFMEEE